MCLAIPGKIVEISLDNADSALVDVIGVRRNSPIPNGITVLWKCAAATPTPSIASA
jgi:hypothetical protein